MRGLSVTTFFQDLKSSLAVAFVAIPLALGVALASGVPPAAGLFTCMVGGLILGIFGGGFVSIGGTSKMLIGVLSAAMLQWGGGEQAYGYILAAGVVAGVLQFILGYLKMGDLGDFFPSTAIQAMLTSIGFIILAKQLHVAMGVPTELHGIVELLLATPGFLIHSNPLILALAAAAILLQYGHSRWTWWGVQSIPSVVLVVVGGWAFSHFTNMQAGWTYTIFGKTYSMGPEHLVSLPDSLQEAVFFPDFSIWKTVNFWTTALAILMVAGIESVISSKAIDRLDPKKRRTNLNKELRSVGAATGLAGAIGGIPVIAEIVRSATNVFNGGKSRWANILHAILILGLTWFGMSELQKIPTALLAAILIYSAYKLIKPAVFKNAYALGLGDFLVFVATLLTIVVSNLLVGLAVGILGGALLIIRAAGWQDFLRYWRKPNVLLQMESPGRYHLSVRGFAIFTNYLRLKHRLDRVPRNATLVLDFTLCSYLDHSVQEHLEQLADTFAGKGGEVEWVGLANLRTSGKHPQAAKGTTGPGMQKKFLSARQQELYALGVERGYAFKAEPSTSPVQFMRFPFFRYRKADRVLNMMSAKSGRTAWEVVDLYFHQGEFLSQENLHMTCGRIKLNKAIPHFVLTREQLLDKLVIFAGWKDLDFPEHPRFSDQYWLRARNEERVRNFLNQEVITFLEENPAHQIESDGQNLLIFLRERLVTREEYEGLVSFVAQLAELLNTPQPHARTKASN